MRFAAFVLVSALLVPTVAFADPVTPTSVTFTFDQILLASGPNYATTIASSVGPKTFSRADPDFEGTTLSNVTIPYGRYTGLNVCYDATVQILLDGVTYQGYATSTTGTLPHGQPLWTTASGVTTTNPGSALPYTYVPGGPNTQYCAQDVFPSVLCVVDSPSDVGEDCKPGDEVYTAQGKVVPFGDGGQTTVDADITLQIYLLVDLYNSVNVDPYMLIITGIPSIHVTVGQPGAAVHLTATDGVRNTADVGFLFGPDKSLLWAEYAKTDDMAYPGMCAGQSSVYLTAQPPSSSFLLPNVYPVGQFDASEGGGEVVGPILGGECEDTNDPNQCLVIGDNMTTGVLQSVDQQAQLTCIPDSQGPFEAMGYQYRSASQTGGDGSSVALTISRIVDPDGLLGTCTSNFVQDRPGTCAKSGNGADGYPQ
jgi:hypothetical protein